MNRRFKAFSIRQAQYHWNRGRRSVVSANHAAREMNNLIKRMKARRRAKISRKNSS